MYSLNISVCRTLLILLLLFSTSFTGWAQFKVYGTVLHSGTGQPLAGASVYINNSTSGAISDEQGVFSFSVKRPGFYEVVVSFVGFQTLVYKASIQDKDLRITFKLDPKPAALRNVVVVPDKTRQRWLKIFRDNFLGISAAAQRCRIENEEEVLFEAGEDRKAIMAFSNVPLVVVNKELGYKIHFQLESFYFHPVEARTYFFGYTRFEELKEGAKIPARYIRNRINAYKGSSMHFFHSLIDRTLTDQGFALLRMQALERHDPRAQQGQGMNTFRFGGDKIYVGAEVLIDSLLRRDTSAKDTEVFSMQWEGRLRVKYRFEPSGKAFLMRTQLLSDGIGKGTTSYLDLLESPLFLDKNGAMYNPMAIQLSGYWSYEKLANMLPINYRPGD